MTGPDDRTCPDQIAEPINEISMVDRCVCHQVSFSRVKARAEQLRAEGITGEAALLGTLAEELKCTTGCGMCGPYVRLTLRTGRVAFDHREAIVRAACAES